MISTITTFSINDQFNELVKVTLLEQQALTENSDSIQQEMIDGSAKIHHFFQGNKPSERKYTTTRIKSIHFLSNISYVGINKKDFYNENFIFDVYLLVTTNLNPFSLDRKLNDQNKHEMIYMLWKECIPQKIYKHICKKKNFLYLNRKNVLQSKVSEIIRDFLEEGDENYIELRNNLCSIRQFLSTFI